MSSLESVVRASFMLKLITIFHGDRFSKVMHCIVHDIVILIRLEERSA
uniref:Uncharacterized protein n=1 Tax=Arundo donax TaxID=35708 RepID=A0A0A8YCE1_ARUDO